MNKSDLLQIHAKQNTVFALYHGEQRTYQQFWQHVDQLAAQLPEKKYLINCCEDRYLFSVVLFSAAKNGSVSLLPPSKSSGILDELALKYGPLSVVSEQPIPGISIDYIAIDQQALAYKNDSGPEADMTAEVGMNHVQLDPEQAIAIAFTSGSTGHPKPQLKHWGGFVDCAQRAIQHLGLSGQQYAMLSTTPPQHMFGLETSVIWPYISDLVLVNKRPFYPEDIRLQVQSSPYPIVLCSTPMHLSACVNNGGDWSNLAKVICSTAPLPSPLASRAEAIMGVEIRELYGSTETLSYASRRTAKQTLWSPYSGVSVQQVTNQTVLNATYLQQPVVLDDVFEIHANGQFEVIGRAADLVKIGGKRSSIAELNQRLQAIHGIADGCFFQIEQTDSNLRLGVVVVSTLGSDIIIKALKRHLDEVFIPRVIYYSDGIPRNDVGKIIDKELKMLIEKIRGEG